MEGRSQAATWLLPERPSRRSTPIHLWCLAKIWRLMELPCGASTLAGIRSTKSIPSLGLSFPCSIPVSPSPSGLLGTGATCGSASLQVTALLNNSLHQGYLPASLSMHRWEVQQPVVWLLTQPTRRCSSGHSATFFTPQRPVLYLDHSPCRLTTGGSSTGWSSRGRPPCQSHLPSFCWAPLCCGLPVARTRSWASLFREFPITN